MGLRPQDPGLPEEFARFFQGARPQSSAATTRLSRFPDAEGCRVRRVSHLASVSAGVLVLCPSPFVVLCECAGLKLASTPTQVASTPRVSALRAYSARCAGLETLEADADPDAGLRQGDGFERLEMHTIKTHAAGTAAR